MKNFKDTFPQTGGEDFPQTTSKNSSGGDALDGTHFNKNFIDDWWGFAQAALSQAGLTPSGNSETASVSQILSGITSIILTAATSDDIGNDSGVSGPTVTAALDELVSIIGSITSDGIGNDSGVSGATVTDALDELDNKIVDGGELAIRFYRRADTILFSGASSVAFAWDWAQEGAPDNILVYTRKNSDGSEAFDKTSGWRKTGTTEITIDLENDYVGDHSARVIFYKQGSVQSWFPYI